MEHANANPEFDRYIEQAESFAAPIFEHLRSLIHSTCPTVSEKIKWGIPHFDYADEMMCVFAAYKRHCSFSFWKGSLLNDPRFKQNHDLPATRRFMGKLTTIEDLPPDGDLVAWIKEAMSLNERGIKLPGKAPQAPREIEVHPDFAARLSASPEVEAIFESKAPSFRKEYCVWIADAKTDATRSKRIDEALSWIAEGKGRFWKYAKGG